MKVTFSNNMADPYGKIRDTCNSLQLSIVRYEFTICFVLPIGEAEMRSFRTEKTIINVRLGTE